MDEQDQSQKLHRGRRLCRRRWARVSFSFLIAEAAIVLLMLLFSPERAAIAAALGTAAAFLGPINVALVGVVLGYLGFSAMEHSFGKGQ